MRGQNGVKFDQECTGHVRFFLALLLAKVANERLKILTSLFFDLQTSVRGQNVVEFYQESTGHVGFFLALLLAEIVNERLKILTSLLFDLQTSTSALAKTTLWKVFGRKVWCVLKYSGNSLLDRHQNFFI